MSRLRVVLRGTMKAHTGTVTAIAAPSYNYYNYYNMIISSSRDKSIIVWHLTKEDTVYGIPLRRLTGHSDSVEDVVLSSESSNCRFALSGSKDGELRLWDLETGTTVRRFIGHTSKVLSVSISIDDRHIVSASRDNTIKLWNTLGECKYTIEDGDSHSEEVSCVRLSPTTSNPIILSCSWDKTVKIWDLSNCKLRKTVKGHDRRVKSVTISPECSVGASGGDDGLILLWDPSPKADDKYIGSLDAGDVINALCFHPSEYWITVATESSVQIWDLESKTIIQELTPDLDEEVIYIYCTSLCWSADGATLFTGCNNGVIRVYTVCRY